MLFICSVGRHSRENSLVYIWNDSIAEHTFFSVLCMYDVTENCRLINQNDRQQFDGPNSNYLHSKLISLY